MTRFLCRTSIDHTGLAVGTGGSPGRKQATCLSLGACQESRPRRPSEHLTELGQISSRPHALLPRLSSTSELCISFCESQARHAHMHTRLLKTDGWTACGCRAAASSNRCFADGLAPLASRERLSSALRRCGHRQPLQPGMAGVVAQWFGRRRHSG